MTIPSATRYAAIYARVSTEDQGKGYSLATQVAACQTFATEQGYMVLDVDLIPESTGLPTIEDQG